MTERKSSLPPKFDPMLEEMAEYEHRIDHTTERLIKIAIELVDWDIQRQKSSMPPKSD